MCKFVCAKENDVMPTNFYLSPRPDKNGECPIRASISVHGVRLISTVGYNISPDKWNNETKRVKGGYSNFKKVPYNVINARLKKIDSHFADYEIRLDHKPSIEELADNLAQVKGKARKGAAKVIPGSSPIIVAFDSFVREESRLNQWAEGTIQCWRAFRNHLDNQQYLRFEDFDKSGVAKFIDYLRTKRGMSEKTVQKHYSNLMWFLGWCARKGYYKGDIHSFKPKFKVIPPPVIFLTKEELMRLYHYEIPANGSAVTLFDLNGREYVKTVKDASALEKTRDLFCFCAFTSLRYSDMAKLKRTDIIGNQIHVVTKKTDDALIIDINDYSNAILNKYKGKNYPGDLALPVISNQKMNDYVKELGELCGINTPITKSVFKGGQRIEITRPKWEMLGTHAGRRTFICYALSVGIPPQVVMKWTGHSDYKAMKPYIEIAESTKAAAMKKLNDNLKGQENENNSQNK